MFKHNETAMEMEYQQRNRYIKLKIRLKCKEKGGFMPNCNIRKKYFKIIEFFSKLLQIYVCFLDMTLLKATVRNLKFKGIFCYG